MNLHLLAATALAAVFLLGGAGVAAAKSEPLPPKLANGCVSVRTDFAQTGSGWKVQAAVDEWNRAQVAYQPVTLPLYGYGVAGCADVWVHRYYSTTDGQCAFTNWDRVWPPVGYDAGGRALVWGADIYVNDACVTLGVAYTKRTVAHELGHAMGLPHSTSSRSVMNTSIMYPIPAQVVGPVDVRELDLAY